mmetsp:Transcript_3649/g.5447  ORF Transcript_3649/g.5447 Transcript_3649/m.5447 type:complete len:450 (-) Transcript_3649:495-1844(-)
MLLHDCNPKSRFTIESKTTIEQQETEDECSPFFVHIPSLPRTQIDHLRQVGLLSNDDNDFEILLLRQKHIQYLTKALSSTLPAGFVSLDASRPWVIYWTLHSLDLLNALPCVKTLSKIIDTLQRCFTEEHDGSGGFGGGPQQMPHCATSYAAVMALCILAGAESCEDGLIPSFISIAALSFLQQIRCKLYKWLYSLRVQTIVTSTTAGNHFFQEISATGFRVHRDGEVDVRGTYTVLAMCTMLNIITDELTEGVAEYAAACQTYEGGFGGEPNVGEAHGGYAYCALATLHLLDKTDMIADKFALRGWLARRQLSFEGGFSGRANKLVDGCYSFWQGACMALLNIQFSERSTHEENMEPYLSHGIARSVEEDFLTAKGEEKSCEQPLLEQSRDEDFQLLFDQYKLQRYILLCAQEPSGGLRGVSLIKIELSTCLVFFPSYFVFFFFLIFI